MTYNLEERLNDVNNNINEGKEAIVSALRSIGWGEESVDNEPNINQTFEELSEYIRQSESNYNLIQSVNVSDYSTIQTLTSNTGWASQNTLQSFEGFNCLYGETYTGENLTTYNNNAPNWLSAKVGDIFLISYETYIEESNEDVTIILGGRTINNTYVVRSEDTGRWINIQSQITFSGSNNDTCIGFNTNLGSPTGVKMFVRKINSYKISNAVNSLMMNSNNRMVNIRRIK